MIFAGKDIEQVYKAKSINFDVSFYTDFERQQIVDDGAVVAAVEAPTIRQIACDILLKVESKEMLHAKVLEITEWLINAGTDKLFGDLDRSRYYMAKCTKVEPPKYHGLAAILHVTFTCRDCRPYNASTNQPIGNIYSDVNGRPSGYFSNFTFHGLHCLNNCGCVFVIENFTFLPPVRRHAYEIAGRNGTIRYQAGAPVTGERSLTGWLYLVNSPFTGYPTSEKPISKGQDMNYMHLIADWLVNGKRSNFIFDCDTSRQYKAEVVNAGQLDFENWRNGRLKVEFILQPYCETIAVSQETATITATNLAGSGETFYFTDMSLPVRAVGVESYTPVVVEVDSTIVTGGADSAYGDVKSVSVGYIDEFGHVKYLAISGGTIIPSPKTAGGSDPTFFYRLRIDSRDYTVSLYKVTGTTEEFVEDMTKYVQSGDFPAIYPTFSSGSAPYIRVQVNQITPIASGISSCSASFTARARYNARWI